MWHQILQKINCYDTNAELLFYVSFQHTVRFADRLVAINEGRLSTTFDFNERILGLLQLIVICLNHRSNQDKLKSKSNHILANPIFLWSNQIIRCDSVTI